MNELCKSNIQKIIKEIEEREQVTLTENEVIEAAISALVTQENFKSVKILALPE